MHSLVNGRDSTNLLSSLPCRFISLDSPLVSIKHRSDQTEYSDRTACCSAFSITLARIDTAGARSCAWDIRGGFHITGEFWDHRCDPVVALGLKAPLVGVGVGFEVLEDLLLPPALPCDHRQPSRHSAHNCEANRD